MTKVSVIIPTYNNSECLKRALDSVLSQTFQDFEIIVTDDSTNLDSQELIVNYGDERIKYFHNNEPLGSPKNWNYALSKASGEYIKILHHDDWFADEKSLGKFVGVLDANPSFDFVYSQSVDVFEDKSECKHDFGNKFALIKEDIYTLFPDNYIGAPSVTMYRNKFDILFDEHLKWFVDLDFYIRILEKSADFKYIEEPLVKIGISESSVTKECQKSLFLELSEAFYMYIKYWRKIKDYARHSHFIKRIVKQFLLRFFHVKFIKKLIAIVRGEMGCRFFKRKIFKKKEALENNGERVFIDANSINYDKFDIYQKSHYKRYCFAQSIICKGDVIGDFACGTGYGSVILSKNASKVVGCDINEFTIAEISKLYESNSKVEFINKNLLDLDFVDKFDKIISFETIEHFPENDILKLFGVFSKALRRNGTFIFSVPYKQEASEIALKMGHHKTFEICEQKIVGWLGKAGFKVSEIYYQNYQTHEICANVEPKDFIICVAQKFVDCE